MPSDDLEKNTLLAAVQAKTIANQDNSSKSQLQLIPLFLY